VSVNNLPGTDASANPYRFQGGYEDTSGFYKFGDEPSVEQMAALLD
jgi:hypothetical protein